MTKYSVKRHYIMFGGQTSKNVQDVRKLVEVELVCHSVCSDVLGDGLKVKFSTESYYAYPDIKRV